MSAPRTDPRSEPGATSGQAQPAPLPDPGRRRWPQSRRPGDRGFRPGDGRSAVRTGEGDAVLADVAARGVAIVGWRAQHRPTIEVGGVRPGCRPRRTRCGVVSGGAYGIDAAAHSGALATDRRQGRRDGERAEPKPYPPGNATLLQRVAGRGLMVSELPPGEHPTRARFLARNRLIAALCPATIIVEAAWRNGALPVSGPGLRTQWVLAVRVRCTARPRSPHRLIRDAEAVLCTGVADVLELVGPLGRQPPALTRSTPPARRALRRRTGGLRGVSLRGANSTPARSRCRRAGGLRVAVSAILDRIAESGLIDRQAPAGD